MKTPPLYSFLIILLIAAFGRINGQTLHQNEIGIQQSPALDTPFIYTIISNAKIGDFSQNKRVDSLNTLIARIEEKIRNAEKIQPDPKRPFETTYEYEARLLKHKNDIKEIRNKMQPLLFEREKLAQFYVPEKKINLNLLLNLENYDADQARWLIDFKDPISNTAIEKFPVFIDPKKAEQVWLNKDRWQFYSVVNVVSRSIHYAWIIPQTTATAQTNFIFSRILVDAPIDANNNHIHDKLELYVGATDPTEPVENPAKQAEFAGDWSKYLIKYLNASVPGDNDAPPGTYPALIRFVVDVDGSISNVTAITSWGYGIEEEAIRVILKSPKWRPALDAYGNNVKAYKVQPITFVASED